MEFTDAESSAFWPVYKEYELELSKINDTKLQLIQDFAKNYNALTDKKARELVKRTFELDTKRIDLQEKYFKKFEKVVSSKTAAKFFQVERLINLLVDVQVAAELPLIK